MTTSIAFIGLGHMGLPMAVNLVKSGYSVTGFDLIPAVIDAAAVQGIVVARSATEAVAGATIVITMLPSGRHVIEAYESGLIAAARPKTLFIDSSTIAVDDARTAAALALAGGHRGLDAPVSGGVVGAEAGTLAFMVGGPFGDFTEALPVLKTMGERIVHCGASGLGQAAKICNNMILGVSMVGVSEAFVLGEKLGLSHEALYDVASNASGQCWALTTNCPVPGPVPTSPANYGYQAGFAGALMAKDLGLAAHAIESTGVRAEVGSLTSAIYQNFAKGESAGLDFSGIINVIREQSDQKGAA